LKSLRSNLDPSMKVVGVDAHINDPIFADASVLKLIDMPEKMTRLSKF